MTPTGNSARDDLAYMRALVEAPGTFQRSFGEGYFAAGLCYGVQMLLHAGQRAGWIPSEGPVALAIGLGPTLVFLVLLAWIIRRRTPTGVSMVSRAVAAVLGAAGVANLVLIAVIGSVAWQEHSLIVWLIYPCTVFVLQGMAWLVIYALRRRTWFGIMALGWFASAVAMAFAVHAQGVFLAVAGFAFIAFMLIPGWLIMRQPRIG